jgi:hypothetical protein
LERTAGDVITTVVQMVKKDKPGRVAGPQD